jgi:hypothetical protein
MDHHRHYCDANCIKVGPQFDARLVNGTHNADSQNSTKDLMFPFGSRLDHVTELGGRVGDTNVIFVGPV